MKDDVFELMNEEQRSFWNYKFKDKIKFNFTNGIAYALLFLLVINSFILSAAWLLFQDVPNEVAVNGIVQGIIPTCVFFLSVWLIEFIVNLVLFFYWNYKESEWLKKEVL